MSGTLALIGRGYMQLLFLLPTAIVGMVLARQKPRRRREHFRGGEPTCDAGERCG